MSLLLWLAPWRWLESIRDALAKRLWQKAPSGCCWYADLYTVSDGRWDCCFLKWWFVESNGPELVERAVEESKVNCQVSVVINYTADWIGAIKRNLILIVHEQTVHDGFFLFFFLVQCLMHSCMFAFYPPPLQLDACWNDFPFIICSILNSGLTWNWPVRLLRFQCRASKLRRLQSWQRIVVLIHIAFLKLCDQIIWWWSSVVGNQHLVWISLDKNTQKTWLNAVGFTRLRYTGQDLFFFNNRQEAHHVTQANCSN